MRLNETYSPPVFRKGWPYRRKDLIKQYGGDPQKGIARSARYNLIFVFTSPRGEERGYKDGWSTDGTYHYTAEGPKGDMELTGRNAHLVRHVEDGRDVHLFSSIGRGFVKYVGQMICLDYHELDEDFKGTPRRTIVFRLVPFESVAMPNVEPVSFENGEPDALNDLSKNKPSDDEAVRQAIVRIYQRSRKVSEYALARANGRCEHCGNDAPFVNEENRPFLEVHHILRLSDGGPDDPRFMAALCPNCHRRAHYGIDARLVNAKLLDLRGGDGLG